MSAFIVEDKTINKVVTKIAYDRDGEWQKRQFKEKGYDLDTVEGKNKLGWDMFALNIRAVNMRYEDGHAEDFRPLNYKFMLEGNFPKVSVLKSLKCWLYQCSEGDCDKSDLYKMMDNLANSWAYDIVSSLPEYDKAVWG